MQSIFVIAGVIGFMEFVKALFARDYQKAIIIIGAAVIGGFAGGANVDGIKTIYEGVVAGLAASGTYRVGKLLGGNQ